MVLADIASVAAQYVPVIITAAAAAAAVLPQPTSEPWLTLRKLLDWAALNFGNAKNLPK